MNDRFAVISGASHGLGHAVSNQLAALGAHVIFIAQQVTSPAEFVVTQALLNPLDQPFT